MSRDIWNPHQYRAYSSHRARPFYELLARVDVEEPAYVVDLGCGPGERTADLAARWPNAVIEGIDSSEQMIAEARRLPLDHSPSGSGSLAFSVGDIDAWVPSRPVDVIFSNAAFQWVPGHQDLLARWVGALAPGGRLAFSMPGNFDQDSHRILRELCESPRWRDRLAGVNRHDVVSTPAEYFRLLSDLGCEVDAWETTYIQVLHGDDPVLEWMKGTALRPAFDVLKREDEREEFVAELSARLREAYPPGPHGTIFPFRRIFVVASAPPARQEPSPQGKPA
ncbi:trans-aconitate 2-methyltransferase [Actinoallomurus iriomotensis]|uniref:Trans-aconitate 2-methyltransferase n=1 Tax=Actinoallomurus iriomotensis TaxID=478107 RepID=A0A9W6S0A6_9ACTN|nr:trans-aconitate 2-methyltransferase [Actinoallomurus iriomotensis]GLY84946.1 trans-aconitate 2-methyltransferase [Actinoallomurus iriomotensis]